MKKIVLLVTVSMVCLVFGGGAIAQPNKYWAMDVGNFWNYNGSNPQPCGPAPTCTWTSHTEVAAIDTTTVDGFTTYRTDSSGGVAPQDMDWYSVNPSSPFDFRWHRGEYTLDQMTVTFDGGLFVGGKQPITFSVPLVENTTGTFNDPGFNGPIDITSTVTLVGFGPVAVPLGTFQAYEVHRQISVDQLGGQVMDRTQWFAPYIGIVKDVEILGPGDVDTKELAQLNVATVFSDVPITRDGPPVTVNPFYQYIMGIYDDGITTGCAAGAYCPGNNVTRQQMAAFIVRAVDGVDATVCTGGVFNDVPFGAPQCANIERLRALNITLGCGGGNYCPLGNVTRQEMASFLVRAVDGFDATTCSGTLFTDVPLGAPHCANIERLRALNVTQGCVAGMYCPSNNVVRDQMAAFLARAFLGMQ